MNSRLPIFLWMLAVIFFNAEAAGQSRRSRQKQHKAPVNFTIQEIVPGVWAAIQNDNYGWAICNAGIVDLGDKTLIFDPFMTPAAARELKDVAMELTGKPVTIVVNSHFHNDHIRGNQVFSPEATIISTRYTRNEIAKIEPEEQEWEKKHAPTLLKATKKRMNSAGSAERQELPYWIGYYEGMVASSGELRMTLPDIVFDDSLWIMGSARNVKLVECKNGHTASDAVMLIPSDGVAFMGDLLFVQRHPWISDGRPESWQASLKKFYEDPAYTIYIPGHGPVANRDALQQLYQYLGTLEDLAKSATSDSLQYELIQRPIPNPYQHWYFGRFYEPNLQYLFSLQPKH